MVDFLNPESAKQMADQLSNLWKQAEKIAPSDIKTSFAPIDQPINSLGENTFCKRLPRTGEWSGETGNSDWYPDRVDIPTKANEEGQTWGDILDKHGIDGIPFKDGEPDFSEVSKGTVEIDDFSTRRFGAGGNFDQADQKLAEQRGCTVEEVQQWRADNDYTWHEKQDCKTMEKVPREIHHNVPHTGGISVLKSKQSETK